MTATIEGILFRRDSVVLEVEVGRAPDDEVDLSHVDAVALAGNLIAHVALGAIDAGEVVDPSDELNRIIRAAAAVATALLCDLMSRLRALREAEATGGEVAIADERVLTAHDGGGETTAAREPTLAVVRDGG